MGTVVLSQLMYNTEKFAKTIVTSCKSEGQFLEMLKNESSYIRQYRRTMQAVTFTTQRHQDCICFFGQRFLKTFYEKYFYS